MRRKFLIFLVFLIALAAITTGVGWYLLQDEAFLKSQLSAQTLKYTGRELTFNGPVTLDLGRQTTLKARDVHFSNVAWAKQPDMAAVGYLLISIDLTSLFSDRIIFPALVIDECTVNLQRNDAGEANWSMHRGTGPESKPVADKPPRTQMPVWFKDIKLAKCQLNISSIKLDEPLDIKVTDLAMLHHDDSRWESKGSGSVNDQPLELDGWFAPFDAIVFGGPLEYGMNLSLGDIFNLQSSGSVQDAKTWSGANVTTELKGPDIAAILNEFKLPLFSEGAFDYKLILNTEGKMTRIDLDGDLGSVDISAKGELDQLIGPHDGNIQFSIDGPNLGALAKVFGIDGVVENSFSHQSHVSFENGSAHIKRANLTTDLDQLEVSGHFKNTPGFAETALDFHFNSDEAGRWTTLFGQPQQALGELVLDGSVSSDSNGMIVLKAKTTQAMTTLDVDGSLGHLPGAIQPDLNIVFSSPDPSHLAAIAGFEKFPAAPLSIKGRFGWQDKQLQLGKVNINLAGDQADINGHLNLQNRYAGSDLSILLDIRNAGKLGRLFGKDGLPDEPAKLTAVVKPDGNGLAFQVSDGNLRAGQLELSGRIPDLQQPLKMDGDIDINLPRLSDVSFLFPDTKLPDSPFTARGKLKSNDQGVQLENITISLADDQATVNGNLNLGKRYAGSDLRAQIDIKNAGALGRMFGHEGIPDQPMKLEAEVKPQGKGLAFTVNDGNLGDMQLELQGQIADMEHPMGLDAQFDIHLPRLSDLSFLFKNRDLPDVPFSARGSLTRETSQTRLEKVQLAVGMMTASVDGSLSPDNSFNLTIKAAGPDASRLEGLVGTSLPAESFSLASGLSGNPSNFQLKNMDLYLGESKVDGNLSIALGDIKHFKGNLDSPHLDLSHWIASEEAGEKPSQAVIKQWRFDDTPVMRLTENQLDIDLHLKIDELILENAFINDIQMGLVLSHQLLQLNRVTLRGYQGGQYNGEFSLDSSSGTPIMHLNMTGKDLRLGLAAAPGQDPSTYPPIDLDVALDGAGQTRRELASSLTGKIRIYQGSGQVANAGLDVFFSDFLTQLFTTLNPLAKSNQYTQLECAVIAADAESGMVKVFPVIFQTEQLTILSDGTVDLNTEKIDLSFNTKPRKGLGLTGGALLNQLIKVGGTLAAPAIEFDPAGTITSGGLAVATMGISVLAKSVSDRFLSSKDPCGEARKEIAKQDSAAN